MPVLDNYNSSSPSPRPGNPPQTLPSVILGRSVAQTRGSIVRNVPQLPFDNVLKTTLWAPGSKDEGKMRDEAEILGKSIKRGVILMHCCASPPSGHVPACTSRQLVFPYDRRCHRPMSGRTVRIAASDHHHRRWRQRSVARPWLWY